MPIEPIPNTPAGWPYLPDNAPIADLPALTQALAAALAGFTPGNTAPVADTGWVAIGVNTAGGFAAGAIAPAVRIVAGVAYYRGSITGAMTINVTATLGFAPAGTRPPDNGRAVRSGSTGGGLVVPYLAAWADGVIAARPPSTGTHEIVLSGLSGVRFN